MAKKTCVLRMKLVNGVLRPVDGMMKERMRVFKENVLPEEIIEVLMEAVEPNNTKSQLAKIHVMIKEIADETGETMSEAKNSIKKQIGMTRYENGKLAYKSFADESRESLSDAIEKIYIIGDFLNINFRKDLD